jgi:hypothetical protein
MKKLPIVLVLLMAAATLQAQLEVRPHAGFNTQELTKTTGELWSGMEGLQGGVQLMLGRRLFFAPGAQYAITNSRVKVSVPGEVENRFSTFSTQAFRFPALLGWRSGDPREDPLLNLRLFAGPTMTMVVGTSYDPEVPRTPEVQPQRWSVGGGVGVDLWKLFFDLGYDVGLDDVFAGEDPDRNARANVVMVNAGIRLNLIQ